MNFEVQRKCQLRNMVIALGLQLEGKHKYRFWREYSV
jgi:hypothetical protein